MNEEDTVAEGVVEDFDELAGEGDFGDEEDGGFLRLERVRGHLEVEIGLTTTGDAAQKTSAARGVLELSEGFSLSRIEVDEG